MKADIGILGLGVMGKSLARNFASRGLRVAVYNLPLPGEEKVVADFIREYRAESFIGGKDMKDFIEQLHTNRIILLMVKSGNAVDELIEQIKPNLSPGDILIDAGNSFYRDTIRRVNYLKTSGINFVGMGVSGGEEGALKGPSIMPAGTDDVKIRLMPLLRKIAAIADKKPCVAWMGTDGAGHFVKMVHNGIEYADMQIISEVYHISKSIMGQSNHQTADMMQSWQKTILKSYLLEITIDILRYENKGESLLEKILDVAGHKGTGQWTINEALQFGIAIPTITAAMNERIISGNKSLRSSLSDLSIHTDKNKGRITKNMLKGALIFSRLVALAEGIHLIQYASKHYKWPIDIAEVAQIWRGGCIIRSEMLLYVKRAFSINNEVNHLFEIPEIASLLLRYKSETEKLLSILIKCDISSPSISAALNYYKSMHTSYLPINLIQAQRDYFGAHTYKIVEKGETIYHTKWGK